MDGEAGCYYRDLHGDTTINGAFLDSTFVVEYDYLPNKINDKKAYEIYAKGIGLIYKYFKDNHYYDFPVPGTPVDKGTEVYYMYFSSGIE